MISVIPVKTQKEFKDFVEFPYLLYRHDRYWVPPLRRDVYTLFDKTKNPFWNHAERQMFLAYRGKQLAGRICAIVDYNFIEFWEQKTGYFGFFECDDDEDGRNPPYCTDAGRSGTRAELALDECLIVEVVIR